MITFDGCFLRKDSKNNWRNLNDYPVGLDGEYLNGTLTVSDGIYAFYLFSGTKIYCQNIYTGFKINTHFITKFI